MREMFWNASSYIDSWGWVWDSSKVLDGDKIGLQLNRKLSTSFCFLRCGAVGVVKSMDEHLSAIVIDCCIFWNLVFCYLYFSISPTSVKQSNHSFSPITTFLGSFDSRVKHLLFNLCVVLGLD
jgi:hypothetical protein